MSVGYILSQAGSKLGLNPADTNARKTLLRYLNEAAREIYVKADLAGSLMEQVFKVNGDQTITCPHYVGQIRGVRELASMQIWHINQMRPRYNQFNWPDMWRNIRLKNIQALQTSVTNQSVGVITVKAVENPPITVYLSGPTPDASLVNETVIMDAVQKQTINVFLDYTAVKKSGPNSYDVTLSDVDGKVLTVIPNTEKEAKYQIIDVSSCPWLPQNTSQLDNYLEILYKKTLPYLSDDNDEFPAFNYDDVIVNRMMHLAMVEQGKTEQAKLYEDKSIQVAADVHNEQNRATEDVVALVQHPHDTLLKRVNSGMRRRYSMYAGRKQ